MLSKAEFDQRFGAGRIINPPFEVKPHHFYKGSTGAVALFALSTMAQGGVSVNVAAYDSLKAWDGVPDEMKFIILKNFVCPDPWIAYLEIDGLPHKSIQVKGNGSAYRVYDKIDFVVPEELSGAPSSDFVTEGSDISNEPMNWAIVTLPELATVLGKSSIRSMELEPFLTYCKSEGLKVLINGDGKLMIPRNRVVAPF